MNELETVKSTPLFKNLGLSEPIQKALIKLGYETPTPIQVQAIPELMKGVDLLGCAQTGTGKTAAFALPMLEQIIKTKPNYQARKADRLILTPTRELAVQIYDNFKEYGQFINYRVAVVYGGVSIVPQIRQLENGVDVLIATPGRLLDLISQRKVSIQNLQVFVLDEADRMLDMGFIHDIKKIIGMIPPQRQTLLFSATMPQEIQKLANSLLKNPVKIEVARESTTAENITQKVFYVDRSQKKDLLRHILNDPKASKVIVFTRTKHGANKVTELLQKNRVSSLAIHGNKSQNARLKAIDDFKKGKIRVLIATDIASRGIDVDDVTHVINYEIPNMAENYVHRIGRTARAGRSGIALSLCDADERSFIHDIEKTIGLKIEVDYKQPYHSVNVERAEIVSKGKAKAMLEKSTQRNMNRGSKTSFLNSRKKRFFGRGK